MVRTHIRMFVGDEQVLFRRAVEIALAETPDIEITGEASNHQDAVEELVRTRPNVALINLDLEGGGLPLSRWVSNYLIGCRVLFLVENESEDDIVEMLESGASGFVSRKCSADELLTAIRAVSSGELVMPRNVLSGLLSKLLERDTGQEPIKLEDAKEIRLEEKKPTVDEKGRSR